MTKTIAIVLLTASLCLAETYYVAPGGKSTNNGSEASPWPDVNTALLKAGGGHLILVKPGVYPAFTVTVSGSVTSPEKWTVIRSVEKWSARIATAGTNAITVKGQYTSIEGFDVCGAACNGIKVEADSVTIKTCWVHDTTTGIYAPGRSGLTVDMCYFEQCNDGVYLSGTNLHAWNNICWNNRRYGVNMSPSVTESSCYTNIIGANGSVGIRVAAGSKNRVIQNTLYHHLIGIDLGRTTEGTICNNLIAECAVAITQPPGNTISHNVNDIIKNMAGVATVNTSPLFVHPGDLPLALRYDSPAIGKGLYSAAPYADFMGQPINKNRVDCGAVQYNVRLEGGCPCPVARDPS